MAASDASKDVEDIVTKGAEATASLWFSYVFVLFYLLVAAAGVTHRDLFLDNPVKLPFLGVDLPLKGFFRVGPLLFLVAHAYVLLHLSMLAERARAFLAKPTPAPFAINLFVELLVGNRLRRQPFVSELVVAVAWLTLIVGPISLLLFFEVQFLAYHDEWTTWIQRVLVLADLVLIWRLWPRIVWAGPPQVLSWLRLRLWPFYTATIGVAALVLGVATFPGEGMQEWVPWFPLREALVAGPVDPATSRPASLWINRLVLSGIDLADRKTYDTATKLYAAPVITSARGRHLEGAVLIDTVLPRTDFTNAHLEGAAFTRAALHGSWFDNTWMTGAVLDNAQMQGVSLFRARLEAASLAGANLQGAAIAGAQLWGTLLNGAQLQGVSLAGADLRGVSLAGADLRGANLAEAYLQGASFQGANLAGASLKGAVVWRTDFRSIKAEKPGVRVVEAVKASDPSCKGLDRERCAAPVDVQAIHRAIDRYVLDGEVKDLMLGRLRPNLDPDRPAPGEGEIKASDALVENPAGTQIVHERELHKLWKELGCAADGAPFVLASFVHTLFDEKAVRFKPDSDELSHLAKELSQPACAGSIVMSEETKMRLLDLPQPTEELQTPLMMTNRSAPAAKGSNVASAASPRSPAR